VQTSIGVQGLAERQQVVLVGATAMVKDEQSIRLARGGPLAQDE
jgi:hypothetical protein